MSSVRSHVQVKRYFDKCEYNSSTLSKTLRKLDKSRDLLWNKEIPEMVSAYFQDMGNLIHLIKNRLTKNGSMHLIVGDSAYAGIKIPVADILCEIAEEMRFKEIYIEDLRKMKTSAQQGWKNVLSESIVSFYKR